MHSEFRVEHCLELVKDVVQPGEVQHEIVFLYSIPALARTGDGEQVDGASIDSSKFRILGGEILFSKLNPHKTHLGLTRHHAILSLCSSEFLVLRPRPFSDLKFWYWRVQASDFRAHIVAAAQSATRSHMRVRPEVILKHRVHLPPLPTQRAIADFLDRKTAAIDALIEKKQKLLDLLAEKRTALINRAVTKGLDPSVPMKDSWVPTLGSVPAHWTVTRNKNVISERVELSTTGEEELLSVSHLTGVTPRHEKDVTMFMAASNEGYKVVRLGDLVINTLWAWMGALGISSHEGIVSPAYGVYSIDRSRLLPEFAGLFFRNPAYVVEMTRYSRGVWSSRLRLYPESFLGLLIALPPIDEQKMIVEHVQSEVGSFGEASTKLEASIEKLQEYRHALITAAVTGQIDVEAA